MQEKAQIVGFEGKKVVLIPVDISCCINCENTTCKSNGHRFYAVNSNNLSVQVGSQVKVAAPVKLQTKQAILALVIPIVFAVLGFVVTSVFFPNSSEQLRIGIALLLLGISAFIAYQRGNQKAEQALPCIIDIL